MHACRKDHIRRLNRIEGQVRGIKQMMADDQYCIDILTQLKALKGAVKSLEKKVLNAHMQTCLVSAAKSSNPNDVQEKVEELIDLISKSMK